MTNEGLDLQKLSDQIIGLFPAEYVKLSPAEQRLSIQLYRLLARGRPVPLENLASASNISIENVRLSLERCPGVVYDDSGGVIGYWGLALSKMSHCFEVGDQMLYTWCAWDSLF